LLGGLSNFTQPNIPARSNLEWFGLNAATDGALAASGVGCVVPVPVDVGTPITRVSLIIGATAASTPTHQFVAIYPGTGVAVNTGALLAQSADGLTAAVAAGAAGTVAPLTYTLASTVTPTAATAPQGFVYVMVSFTGTAVPTALSFGTPAGINYQWNALVSPAFLSATTGTALGGTAPATLGTLTAKVVAPCIILT
jgi:hypothetical protein